MTVVDVQFNAATADWPRLLEATLAAEAGGAGAVWVFDHLAGRSLQGDRMLECCTWLGALAASTTRIELGTMVANVWNREPGVLAVAAASVVHIAGRRLHLGLGAGTSPTSPFAAEQHAVAARIGATLEERHARVETVLDLFEAMWAEDRDERFDTFPLPRPRPSVLLGVNSAALARVAGARADGINVAWSSPRRHELLAVADEAGAATRPFTRTTYTWWDPALLDPDHPERRAMDAARIDRVVLTLLEPPEPAAIEAAFARHAATEATE
jgi:alkanesulfonate monooxygenase SsuD/methylene tetrahydromethanopterin reductase-like flavin-dependent oxidoreductase (luciferase family)